MIIKNEKKKKPKVNFGVKKTKLMLQLVVRGKVSCLTLDVKKSNSC